MPVFFTDGRKGLVLISKEYEGAYALMHYRTKGSKNGVRKYQYEDGSLTPLGYIHYGIGKGRKSGQKYESMDKVFVSGKVKYDKPLSGKIKREVKSIIKANSKILIGDAPGADTRVQEYLKKKNYQNVEVFTTDKEARNNVGGWKVNKIDASKYTDEREARAQKDIAMTKAANKGLAISSKDDRPDSATSNNINRMREKGSEVAVYDYKTKRFFEKLIGTEEKEKLRQEHIEENKKKEIDRLNARIKSFDSLPDEGPDRHMAMEAIKRSIDNINSGELSVDNSTAKKINEWFDKKVAQEKDDIKSLREKLKNYNDMTDTEKSKIGNAVLEEIAATEENHYRNLDNDYTNFSDIFKEWIIGTVYEKSGDIGSNEYIKGSNASKVHEKIEKLMDELAEYEEKIQNQMHNPSYKKLQRELKNDSNWNKLIANIDIAGRDMDGAILKDLGFSDNPRNRSILWRLII